jgi:hypothetical protein
MPVLQVGFEPMTPLSERGKTLKNGVIWDVVRTDVSEGLRRATRRNIPEDAILHSHRRENLKSYRGRLD